MARNPARRARGRARAGNPALNGDPKMAILGSGRRNPPPRIPPDLHEKSLLYFLNIAQSWGPGKPLTAFSQSFFWRGPKSGDVGDGTRPPDTEVRTESGPKKGPKMAVFGGFSARPEIGKFPDFPTTFAILGVFGGFGVVGAGRGFWGVFLVCFGVVLGGRLRRGSWSQEERPQRFAGR